MTTTTWTTFSGPSGDLPAGLEPSERARRSGHQELVAFINHTLRVARFDVRVSADNAVLAADATDGRHRLHNGGMIVLTRIAEVLREIAFADEHHTDSGYLLQNPRQVIDRPHLFTHDDDQNLAVRHERPHVGLCVVFLRRDAPVARCVNGLIAALPLWFIRGCRLRPRVSARCNR